MGCSSSSAYRYPEFEVYHPYEEILFTQTEKANIDRYLHHLYKRIKLGVPLEEIRHTREGVETCVRTLLDGIAEVDIRFHVERHGLLQVGSFFEGNKLKSPNEFNFVAILSELDSDDLILDDPNHHQNDLPVKLRVREQKDQTFRENWKRAIKEDTFLIGKRTSKIKQNGVLDKFLKQIRRYVKTFSPIQTPVGELSPDGPPSVSATLFKSSVLLKLKLVRHQQIVEDFQDVELAKSYPVYVTLTPAIRWFKVDHYLFKEDVLVPYLYTEVIKSGSFLLYPGADGHFVKSFTEVESAAIRGMSVRHKKALTLVKYLMNGENRLSEFEPGGSHRLFTSYSLKMSMLCFVGTCPCLDGDSSPDYEIADCVLHFLQKLYDNIHGKIHGLPMLPSAFIKTTSTVDENVMADEKFVYLNKVVFTELVKNDLKLWIGRLEKYDFGAPIPRYGVIPLYKKLSENRLNSV